VIIDPWMRTGRVVAYGVAWVCVLLTAAFGGLGAQQAASQRPVAQQPPGTQPPPSQAPGAPPAQTPSPPAPTQPAPGAPPAQTPSPPAPTQPAPGAPPAQTPGQPPAQPPQPTLTPPSPFVPQPGAPPGTLPPQKVAEVVVRGNDKIPTDQILAVVSTKLNDPLNEDKLRSDVQAILNLGVFQDAVVRLEPEPDGVRVVFVVVENPLIEKLDVKGNTVFPTEDVLKALAVPTGVVLNTVTMRAGVRAVEKLYQDKGYVLAHVSDVNVSPDGVLSLQISEGRIEAVKIEGLQKTHDFVVRRELQFKPGDVFNVNAVNASLKKLFALQYFSDVKATPDPGSTPDAVNVTVTVTEQKTAAVSFGVGYSNQTGLEGFVGLRDSNFGGNGQNVSLQYSQTTLFGTSFVLSFHEPHFLNSPTALDLQLFDSTTIPTDYTLGLNNSFNYNLAQVGGFISFTSPLNAINTVNYGFKSVNSTFGNPSVGTNPPAGFPFTPGQVNAVILGAIQDTRNDPLAPTSGERISLAGSFAFQVLGGSFTFQKYELDFQHYFPLSADSTILGHAHLGYSGTVLPIQEQFYLGGQQSLRGYNSGRFRGDELALVQLEYHFPLSSLPLLHSFTGITAIVFVDAGDTQPAGGANWNLKSDVGVGIQVKTPVGPFRLDYGISAEGSQFWVSSGALFF
jgi:outer membrane protein insertion porin family